MKTDDIKYPPKTGDLKFSPIRLTSRTSNLSLNEKINKFLNNQLNISSIKSTLNENRRSNFSEYSLDEVTELLKSINLLERSDRLQAHTNLIQNISSFKKRLELVKYRKKLARF